MNKDMIIHPIYYHNEQEYDFYPIYYDNEQGYDYFLSIYISYLANDELPLDR